MKEDPKSNMSVLPSPELIFALQRCVEAFNPDLVVETGTFLGTGTTPLVARCFYGQPRYFYTLEAHSGHHQQARENLKIFPYIWCLRALSVRFDEALKFMERDPVLQDHGQYPDLYIEAPTWAEQFYQIELRACQEAPRAPEDLLRKLIRRHEGVRPLFVLDSAGGIGWLEFQIVLEEMGDRPFSVFLDDVNHLKHFRSLAHLKADEDKYVGVSNEEEGWAVYCTVQ